MTATMDRRIADRRRTVREAGARRRMRWILALIGATLIGGLVGWLLFESPLMAVSEITISGSGEADVASIVEDFGIAEGMPTISADAEGLVERIVADPWVAASDVSVTWPGSIAITVLEHTPAAWVAAGEGWVLAAADGSALEVAQVPTNAFPTVSVGSPALVPGEVLDPVARGAIAFVINLTDEYRLGATVTGTWDAVTAHVAGHAVSLGHPLDMPEKARALAALLDTDLAEKAPVSLVSPLRPAVAKPHDANPRVPPEGLVEIPPEPQPTG
jgi:cell division protein FtsQ